MKDGLVLDVAGDVEAWVATVLGCGGSIGKPERVADGEVATCGGRAGWDCAVYWISIGNGQDESAD